MDRLTIPIQPVGPAVSACGACAAGAAGPVCRTQLGEACAAATLSGPADELRRLLVALGQRLGFPADAPEVGGVRALRILPGEVELQLSAVPRCGPGAEIVDAAFQTLRNLLPDTDVYVTHAT